ncbi:hypothetical protein MRX96_054797 [Rhipicephalus microplus]
MASVCLLHSRSQVPDHIGDCRPLYVLYLTTVETACNQGVSLLATFWCSVWWFLGLRIIASVVALTLSTYLARAAVQKQGPPIQPEREARQQLQLR